MENAAGRVTSYPRLARRGENEQSEFQGTAKRTPLSAGVDFIRGNTVGSVMDIERINVEAAQSGDRTAIEFVLIEFCNNPHHCSDETRQFVAGCISRWFDISRKKRKEGAPLDPSLGGRAFDLVAPAKRPKLEQAEERHIAGWKAYLLERMKNAGHEAALVSGARIACINKRAFEKTKYPHLEVARLCLRLDGIRVPEKLPRKKRAANLKTK